MDWAGDTATVIDTDTGEAIPAYIFVSSLPYSGYAYVEAFFSINQECWIAAHVNAFRYYGGVTRILQCDNLKTGVVSHGRNEVTLNKAYNEMAEHYGTAILGLLVDQEWNSRKNNHLKRLIKQAKFAESGACVEDIEYHADRNLDQTQIARLSTCNFITERHNVLLLGATGSGKTYIACALGMAAARSFLQVRYVRLPELLTELAIARGNGTYPKVITAF